jgi:hypothetical protein
MNRRLGWLAGAAVALSVFACTDLTIETAVNQIQVPLDSASFRKDIYPVLKATCAASSACHLGPNAPAGNTTVQMDFSTDSAAYANLINVPSQGRPNPPIMRVRPFKSDSSFMYRVITTDPTYRLGYYRMPVAPYALPSPTVETIKNWIDKGALFN